MIVRFKLNGKPVQVDIDPREVLLNTLRLKLRVKSVKRGCERGECGSCTVLVNGNPVLSCLMLTVQINGEEVVTVEGLQENSLFKTLVKNFVENGAVQCGFCTPGILLTTWAGMVQGRIKSAEDVKEQVANICRCTGYVKIVEAVQKTLLEVHYSGQR